MNEDIECAMRNISPELRSKLNLEYNIKILNKMEFFTKNFTQETILEFAS